MYVYNNIDFAPNENIVSDDGEKKKTTLNKVILDSVLKKSGPQSTLEL